MNEFDCAPFSNVLQQASYHMAHPALSLLITV